MALESTAAAVRLKARGPAWILSGLVLAAVTGCGSSADDGVLACADVDSAGAARTAEATIEQSATVLAVWQHRADDSVVPTSLRIPSIGVQAPVVATESTTDRVLLPPRDYNVVAWWSQGAAPGDAEGSAILVGHTVQHGRGVFDDLGTLVAGDTIEVDQLTYSVQSVEVMSKADFSRCAEDLFDQRVPGRLVVVTCEDWDGESWRSNIVAIASPV